MPSRLSLSSASSCLVFNTIKKERKKTCCLFARRLSQGKRQHRFLSQDECEPCPDTNENTSSVENDDLSADAKADVGVVMRKITDDASRVERGKLQKNKT